MKDEIISLKKLLMNYLKLLKMFMKILVIKYILFIKYFTMYY